jgi:hypothetical protein
MRIYWTTGAYALATVAITHAAQAQHLLADRRNNQSGDTLARSRVKPRRS